MSTRTYLNTRQRVDLLASVLLNQIGLLLPPGDEQAFIKHGFAAVDRFFKGTTGADCLRDPKLELQLIARVLKSVSLDCQEWLQLHPTGTGVQA